MADMSEPVRLGRPPAHVESVFIEIYDNMIVLTGDGMTLEFNYNTIISHPGEDAPRVAGGQIGIRLNGGLVLPGLELGEAG